jgi:hypothetical protein
MAKLYRRKEYLYGHPEYTDHYIKTSVKGQNVTYQVLPEALGYLRSFYPHLLYWRECKTGFDLTTEDVIKLRLKGLLKTKRELCTAPQFLDTGDKK